MSRIYDALKKLEAERLRRGGNGRNGGGNGGGNGKRKGWRRFFAGNGRTNGHAQVALRLSLDPEAEEAYQRLGTNLLVPAVGEAGPGPRPPPAHPPPPPAGTPHTRAGVPPAPRPPPSGAPRASRA